MDLTRHVDELSTQLLVAARPGGEEAQQLADRLVMAVEPALRLVLLEVLTEAAAEVSTELAPASIEVRLRGRDPELVVTPAPGAPLDPYAGTEPTGQVGGVAPPAGEADDSATARITLRLPDSLKQRIDDAATRMGLSVNAWLVRTIADSFDPTDTRATPPRSGWGGQQFTGWAR
jgi:hypothetical protein